MIEGFLFYPCIEGEEVSKLDVNLLLPWVHGFLKSGDFTKYTICGNTRETCPFSCFVMYLISFLNRNLQTRRDIREKAWQNDGWAETVSKARFPVPSIEMTFQRSKFLQTAQLAQSMDAFILAPLSFSPLK